MTSFKEEYTETYTSPGVPNNTQTYKTTIDPRFGGKVGGGTLMWLNDLWGLGAEVDYTYVSQDGGSLTYIGMRAMAMVKLPTAK